MTPDDRTAITDLINLHGHLTDSGALDRMHELFTDDVVYDVSDLGHGRVNGLDTLTETALALGDHNPLAHHITNIVLTPVDDDHAHARSKGLGINTDGTTGSVTYDDTLTRTPEGWRITHRTVTARRKPLTP